MPKRSLKAYVWTDVLCDYTCGMAVAMAHDLDEAYEQLAANWWPNNPVDRAFVEERLVPSAVRVIDEPSAFVVYGGG